MIDVACGSGDAQTLCLTDDDMVWSWGDGDYGKLGRGGSDGCKVPMKVRLLVQLLKYQSFSCDSCMILHISFSLSLLRLTH